MNSKSSTTYSIFNYKGNNYLLKEYKEIIGQKKRYKRMDAR